MCITKKGVTHVHTYIHYIKIGQSPELFLVVDIACTGIGRRVGQCIRILGWFSEPYILIIFFETKPRIGAVFYYAAIISNRILFAISHASAISTCFQSLKFKLSDTILIDLMFGNKHANV